LLCRTVLRRTGTEAPGLLGWSSAHEVGHAVPGSTNSLLDEGARLLREFAVQQGVAYRTYGEALQRFGEQQMDWKELFKTSGDIYLREMVRSMWGLVQGNTHMLAWMLAAAGAKPLRPETDSGRDEAPTEGRTKRGRG
jgi:hypothetical protein